MIKVAYFLTSTCLLAGFPSSETRKTLFFLLLALHSVYALQSYSGDIISHFDELLNNNVIISVITFNVKFSIIFEKHVFPDRYYLVFSFSWK